MREIDRMLNEVSRDRLMTFTENISKEVRLSGSAEERRAFEYVKDQLDQAGYETKLEFDDCFISLPGKAQLKVNGRDIPCITHSMARPTGDKWVKGELVHVDPQNVTERLDNRVALVDGLAVPGVVRQIEQAGAAAIIFINAKHTHEMIVSTVWGNPTLEHLHDYPDVPVISITKQDGETVKQRVVEEKAEAQLYTEVDTGWRKIPTLTAELKGREEPENFILFSGHIDSWHYGVMDNGTANATMLEVATVLARHRKSLRRSLRLAFWSGHSHGRYAGSTVYCDKHWEELHDHCMLHVNIDSVGAKGATILTENNCMPETKPLAAEVIKERTGQRYNGSRFGRAGDQSFWGTGTPSLFMGLSEQEIVENDPASTAFAKLFGGGKTGGFGWWWHTTEDTLDKIDPDNLVRDSQIYLQTVYRACHDTIVPIDFRQTVTELKEQVRDYEAAAGELVDWTVTHERLTVLEARLEQLYEHIGKLEPAASEVKQVNRKLLKLGQQLVPLHYVKGDVFGHDPALGQPPVPLLQEAEKLNEAGLSEDMKRVLQNSVRRKLNRFNFSLRQAIEVLEEN